MHKLKENWQMYESDSDSDEASKEIPLNRRNSSTSHVSRAHFNCEMSFLIIFIFQIHEQEAVGVIASRKRALSRCSLRRNTGHTKPTCPLRAIERSSASSSSSSRDMPAPRKLRRRIEEVEEIGEEYEGRSDDESEMDEGNAENSDADSGDEVEDDRNQNLPAAGGPCLLLAVLACCWRSLYTDNYFTSMASCLLMREPGISVGHYARKQAG